MATSAQNKGNKAMDMDIAMSEEKTSSAVYNLSEWTADIEEEYNPESFVREYPKLKQLLETLDMSPIEHTASIISMLNKYQEKPELLDPHLQEICDLLMHKYMKANLSQRDDALINDPDWIVNCGFKIIYTLSIVRGYKTVVRYLPHEVTDLEPTLLYLLAIDQNKLSLWYARYVLCVWLSIIVRVPFDLNSIDSFGDMTNKIICTVKSYLARSEKAREGAAVLISRLFSRPDFEQTHMLQFFDWALDKLQKLKEDENIFLFTGIFRGLAEIFKHAHRDALLPCAPLILERSGKMWSTNKSRVVRKYATKLIQRIGLVFLKPVVASWRYTKSRHVLLQSAASSAHKVEAKTESKMDIDEVEFAVPDEIEFILDILLKSLRDKETVVRWSAAKGIGRITMRLPFKLGDEIVSSVLDLLSPTEAHESWHGGCLCLAELSRRGLLLPSRIGDVIERISKAMLYDIFQGQSSVGDQVRDSACYVAWAFARAYEPALMQPFVGILSKSLLTMTVFDKEIHCRRAASAAFQENVGRQGNFPHGIEINTAADYWSVGLLSNAYLNVSKEIAKYDEYKHHLLSHLVSMKLTYWDIKIRNLAAKALYELCELDVAYMVDTVLPILINRCQSQSVFERHGALCGIALIIRRLTELNSDFSSDLQKHIKNIIPRLEKNRGYRGRGGDRIRMECCNVMEAYFDAKFTLSRKGIDRYQQSIDENLRIAQEIVQNSAQNALTALSKNYYDRIEEFIAVRCEQITVKWCTVLQKEIIASVTRGYCRGLGVLSSKLILPHLKLVVDTLIKKTLITEKEDTRDYETRKFACIALADLMHNIGVREEYEYEWDVEEDADTKMDVDEDEDELLALGMDLDVTKRRYERNRHNVIVDEQFRFVFERSGAESSLLYDRIIGALLLRFEDYEVDRRGDVGSFVRQHLLLQIVRCMVLLAKAGKKKDGETPWLRPALPTLILNMILRQLAEKLDRVRRAAGSIIEFIFDSDDEDIQAIRFESDAQIRSILANQSGSDWSAPAVVFPVLVKALDLESYRRCLIEGLIQSVGCINSTMSKLALAALEPYLNGLSTHSEANQANISQLVLISKDLIYCLQKRHLNQLFMVPFLKAIGILLADKIYFEPLQTMSAGKEFAVSMYNQLKKECYKSTDILKLLTSVKVWIGLILFPDTREVALQRLMIFMGYQYPALRKQTCLQLSSAIHVFGEKLICDEEKQNEVFEYLSSNLWGGDDLDLIREQRNKLFEMFDITPPKLKPLKKKKKRKVQNENNEQKGD